MSQIFMSGGKLRSPSTPGGSLKATFRTWDVHDEGAEVTHVQIVPQQHVVVTASYDGVARLWSWSGMPLGQLDVNCPLGVRGRKRNDHSVAWTFQATPVLSTQEDDPGSPDVESVLAAAKRSAAESLHPRKQLDPASPSLLPAAEPPSPEVAQDHWHALRSTEAAPFYRRVGRPEASENRSWDSVFDCLVNLEKKEAKLMSDASVPRRSDLSAALRPLKGKRWRTRVHEVVPLATLTPELATDVPSLMQSRSQPTLRSIRHNAGRARSVSDILAHRRQPVPRASHYERKTPFPDNDKRPLARITQLAHMGLL